MIQIDVTYRCPTSTGGSASVNLRGDATKIADLKAMARDSMADYCARNGTTPDMNRGEYVVDEVAP